MATLHMEVESVRGTQNKITQEYSNMSSSLGNLTNSVSSTVGSAWVGNSASEFQQQYEELRNTITQNLERLQELANALNSEIAQWEDMASRMG